MAGETSTKKHLFFLLPVLVVLVTFTVLALDPPAKVDYISEYDRISKPHNFDPNENAAPFFEAAFALMAEAPNDVESLRKLWPGDMNEVQLMTARRWVETNRETLDYLRQAVAKPYYWKPVRVDSNEPLMMADTNDLKLHREATYLLCMEAKLLANDGQVEPALQHLVGVYKMGQMLTGPRSLIEQLVGIAISALALNSGFKIIDREEVSGDTLRDLQEQISSLRSNQPVLIDFAAERLIVHDMLDRWCTGYGQEKSGMFAKKIFLRTAGRGWAAWEVHKSDEMYDYFSAVAHKTPWELHGEGNDVSDATGKMMRGTVFMKLLAPAVDRVLTISHRLQVHTEGLIAVIAILRYKDETGRYPHDLQQLVTDGYLEVLPIDGFSGRPLAYMATDDSFKLYTFAEDLDDDGGTHDAKWAGDGDGDYVFWPVQSAEKSEQKTE